MTDSKRNAQASDESALGSSKSLRYQPIPPAIDSFDGSPRFHTFGTLTLFQPLVDVWRMKRWLTPWSVLSRRNSQSPPSR